MIETKKMNKENNSRKKTLKKHLFLPGLIILPDIFLGERGLNKAPRKV
ncbi:MAG: hypothetical protein CM15mP122_4430 [Bacteroidota bacterium]|nr:MAG: hypothetical protein CM15mP122_4430 [Bacteroidota bacterium]